MSGPPLLRIRDLRARFHTPDGDVRAVDGVDLDVSAGERVGIVGESGSGKSALMLAILGLLPKGAASMTAEAVEFEGRDLRRLSREELRRLRGDRISMVFQDPLTSLNPYLTIGDQVGEPLVVHRGLGLREARRRAAALLAEVGIPDADRCVLSYPHQFSGGMRQRAAIAMALACGPALVIADEPTTALDVTVQVQILDLLRRIQEARGTAFLLISHDLGVVARFCGRVDVMYAGRIVERSPAAGLFGWSAHPYTRALLCLARPSGPLEGPGSASGRRLPILRGQPPDRIRRSPGCPFAPRCGIAMDRCLQEEPRLEPVAASPGRERACFAPLPLPPEPPELPERSAP